MIYITADWHLFHENVILYCNRPCSSVNAMHKMLIDNVNQEVGEQDTLIIAGDLTLKGQDFIQPLKRQVGKIKCKKKILVLGNHDKLPAMDYVNKLGFWSVHTSLELERENLVIVHDPAVSVIDKSKLFLCGHVHTLFEVCTNVINVGVDVRNYRPVSMSTIDEIRKNLGK